VTATCTSSQISTDDGVTHVTITVSDALTGRQREGDLIVLPWAEHVAPERRRAETTAARLIPETGIRIVGGARPDDGHQIVPDGGRCFWHPYPADEQELGVLQVMPGATAVLGHRKHRDQRIGPGVYVLRQQRRRVATSTGWVED